MDWLLELGLGFASSFFGAFFAFLWNRHESKMREFKDNEERVIKCFYDLKTTYTATALFYCNFHVVLNNKKAPELPPPNLEFDIKGLSFLLNPNPMLYENLRILWAELDFFYRLSENALKKDLSANPNYVGEVTANFHMLATKLICTMENIAIFAEKNFKTKLPRQQIQECAKSVDNSLTDAKNRNVLGIEKLLREVSEIKKNWTILD